MSYYAGRKLIGKTVRMTRKHKQELIANDSADHVEEFGECEGVVEGFVDYGSCQGPELNVRWKPSGLRYGYLPEHLEVLYEDVPDGDLEGYGGWSGPFG